MDINFRLARIENMLDKCYEHFFGQKHKYDVYDYLGEKSSKSMLGFKYIYSGNGLTMSNHPVPISIRINEFNFLMKFIIRNNIKYAYEFGTGFGISSAAIGLGLKETGGKLVTIDAYIEETLNDSFMYKNMKFSSKEEADGYKSLMFLIDLFDLKKNIYPFVGISPKDVDKSVASISDSSLGKEFIEFVFIDSGHWDQCLLTDFNAIYEYLNKERFVVFMHDFNLFSVETKNQISDRLGVNFVLAHDCSVSSGRGFDLHYYAKNMS